MAMTPFSRMPDSAVAAWQSIFALRQWTLKTMRSAAN